MSKLKSLETELKKYIDELKEQLQHLKEINSNTKIFVEKMVKIIPEKEYSNINGKFIEFQNLHIQIEQHTMEYEKILELSDVQSEQSDKSEQSEQNQQSDKDNEIKCFTTLHLIYDELATAFNLVSSTFAFITSQNYITLYTENMSQTFISRVKYDITQIETAINNYFLYTAKIGKLRITEICLLLTKNLTNFAEEYINQPLVPNFITSLVAQNLIKLGRKHMVLEKLELFKQNSLLNSELNTNTPEQFKFNFNLSYAAQLSRFNLVPCGEFMPLVAYLGKADALPSANWKNIPLVIKAMKNAVILGVNAQSATAFAKLAHSHDENHNLFILNCDDSYATQQNSFIEFNMLPLVDSNYIKEHEMQTAEKSGLNNRIIRRFETVKEHIFSEKQLPFEKKENTNQNSEIKITQTNQNKQQPNTQEILEIMWLGGDNFLYRKCIQLDSKGNKPSDKNYTPSKTRENNLLAFSAPSRPHLYNKIIESKIISAINPKHREVMEKYMNEPIFIPPKEELREFIKTTANETFDQIFNARNNRDKITNLQKMRKFYEDNVDEFAKIAEPAILRYYSYKPDDTNRYSAAMQKEANLSLVVVLDLLCDKFAHYLRKNIEKMLHTVDKNLFVQYTKEDDIKTQLRGYFQKVINDTFDALDAKPSLWEEIEPQLKIFYF